MKLIELILWIIAYSTTILTIFVSLICYKRNLENWETIALSSSLLILIISITASSFSGVDQLNDTTNFFVLVAMILVSLTTPLSILTERKHTISPIWKKLIIVTSFTALLITILAYVIDKLNYVEFPIIGMLCLSVLSSMLFIRITKPKKNIAHLEKSNRIFAIIFIIVLPISLLSYYLFSNPGYQMNFSFALPLVFILLSVNKIFDDIQRLSLIRLDTDIKEQHFKNYSLTEREKEVASLLSKGMTYKQISAELFISIPTVKTHASNIYRKCGVSNRHQLSILLTN